MSSNLPVCGNAVPCGQNFPRSMSADALKLLGLMRRAGKLAAGEDAVRKAVHAGQSVLLLLAADASPNARKRAEAFAAHAQTPLLVLDADKEMLAHAAGVAGGAMFAVCDAGFAKALQKKLFAAAFQEAVTD